MGIANLVSNSVEKENKVMWCKNCNLETNEAICPVCGLETSEDLPVEIYWCNDCRIPVIHVSTAADKGICPVCHGKTRYLTADLRPVFPEERLLIALLLDKAPDALMQKSVWATGSRYRLNRSIYMDALEWQLEKVLFLLQQIVIPYRMTSSLKQQEKQI